jgi:subtilisin-like proprotein convertase family protein
MTYVSCTTTQTNTTDVGRGNSNQQIIGIQVVTSGSSSPLSATSFTVNANGTTNINDINVGTAKIYYTGTSSTFATTTLFGSGVTPTIANYNITGTQTLSNGTNYFWLVYDISATATLNNFVDAQCTSLTVGSARTPSVTTPAGNRKIVMMYCTNTNTTNTSYYIDDFSTTGGTTNITNNNSGFSTNGYEYWPAEVVTQQQGISVNFSIAETGGSMHFGIWVDWNQDGDFADTDENVYINNSTYQTTAAGSFSVPGGATLGNTRMRVVGNEFGNVTACTGTSQTECEDYTFTVTAGVPMSYTSCTTTQTNTTDVGRGTTTQHIIGIQIVTTGGASPLSVTSFTVNANGTTAIADINAANSAKIYYTGTNSNFGTTTLFGQNTPTIANYNITGSQSLLPGTNYFWLVYDISATATVNNFVDAECTSLTVGSARTPSVTAPAGNRKIVLVYCTSTALWTSYMDITRVEFGGMNNTGSTVSLVGAIGTATGTAGMYSDWTSLAGNPTAQQGSTSNLIVRIGGSEYSHRVDVYFDFNQNGDLTDAGESFSVFAYANPTLAHLTTVSITIPLSASLGNTLMRVVCVGASNSSPCGTYSYGETEDYKINITAAPACSGTPTAGTASSDISSFCGTATPTLSATGYTIASGLTFQWQSASAIGGPYTDIPGATTLPYTVSSAITATTYYKLKVTCTNGGGNATTSAITVTNNAATITGTNSPVSINCNNTASLTATASAGTINWYSASTGGSSLATGSPYVTPVITANTSYYCSTISGGSSANVGKVSSPLSDGYYGSANTGLVFNAISAFTLISVKVYVQTAGSNVIIQLQDNTGTPITSSTFNSCPAGLQTLTLNFNVPIGTGYQLVSNNTNNLARDYSGSFPYTLAGTCSITGGLLGGSTSTTYYFFYDWVVSTGCESARTPVNIVLSGGVSAPSCSTPIFPLDLSTTVYPGNPVLSWSSVTGACQSATGYKFYFGTDAGATNIVNGTNLGDVTSYVAGVLTSPTSYFWKIVPTNTAGDASGCPIWSFTTTPSIIIGTDVTTSNIPTPYKGVYDDSKEQYIILKEELLAQGLTANAELTSLAFNVSSKNSTQQFSGYNINIGHLGAADDSYASATWKAPTWTNVYSGNFTTATGWNTHVFTSNFTWNGIDNIVIQVCFNNINTTASDYVYYNDDAPNSVCYNQAIGNVGCNLSAATVSNKRPNMKFTYIPVPTGESDIISANNETSNINYLSYQAAAINTVADGVRVWSFTVRDGGSDLIDADALSTNISNLSITKGSGNGVTDWTNTIRNAALFDGSTKIGEVNVTGEVISFTGLTTLLCTDNSAKTFDLYLSFEASAADNQQFEFEIKHSTASLTGNSSPWKTFSAKSSIVGDDNRLEVIASKIMFMVQPSTTDVDMIMFAYPEVSGVDVNNNLDLDFTGNISITSSGTLAGTPITYTAVNGIAALNTIRHTATATGRKLTATYSTWTAVLSEVFDIVTNTCVITTTPASTYGELYICNGTTINFTGSLTSGTPSAYRWELGNGTLATGATVNNVSYPLNAGYLATVTITNTLGTQCKANVRVMVSGGPNIDYITPGLVTCQTAPYTLTVGATSGSGSDVDVSGYSGTGSVTLSLADPTYLPDITTSTTEYTTTLTYNQFDPAATLTNANYVTVFANFEHSYFGDLEVWLVCPNGQNAHLTNGHANGGSWEFFGEPIDYDSSPTVGDGYDYRWSNATPGFMSMEYYTTLTTFPFTQTFTDNDGNTYTNHDYFPSGTYTPYDNFSSLVGCPLNGDWTIHVKDYLHSDDGTIFEWGLELDNSLMPPAWEYTADIISYDWVGTGISVHPSGPSVVVNPVVTTDYTLTITDEFGCETQRIVNMIVNNCPGVWTGAISTDWNTGGNWNGGLVPAGNCGGIGTEINVVIPDVSASSNRFPVISTDSYCDDLTILPGANLQIAFNGQLTVCGSIDNQATATGLVIKSTSAGTGSLFQNFGAVPATVERYMAGNEWHLAFPTTDAVAVTDYTGGLSSFYSYNETSDDYWNTIYNYGTSGWVAQIAGTTSTDYGYFYKDASSNTLSLDGGNLTVSNKNFAVTYTPNGHLGTDLVNVPVIGNMQWNNFIGWNLVGNPYGCAIDWNYSTGADYTSIENGIYMWDGTADNYKYYMNGGTAYTSIAINQSDATARYIPSGQAFFVKAKNSGTITIPYAARTHTTHSYWKEEGKIIPELLRFQIVKNEFTDETVIWLAAGSTDGHDSDFDLYKRFSMNNQFPQIYTFNNIGNIFALNSFPLITDDKIVPVGIYIGDAGEHTIEFTENNFSNVNVYLEDLLTNQMLNVRTTNSYTFTSVSGLIKDRFVLHFNINTAPVIVNQPSDIEIYEDEYFISDLNNIFEEQDLEDEFSVSISMEDGSDLPQWILKNNLLIEGTPENENVGTHIICVKATDLSGGSTNAYFEITVLNINDEPLINITPENQIALEDESFEIVFPSNTFIDIDLGDFLSYECSLINGNLLPSWILFDQNSLTLTGMPTNDEVGLYNLLIKATDLSGLSTNANFDLEIQNVNDAPYQNFLIGDFEAIENEPFIIDFEDNIFTDVDKDDVLTYSSNFPSWLSFDVSNLIYSGTPEVTGTYKVELIAKDLSNTSASAFFNILVSPETYINFEDNFKIEIYPNPTSGLFTIYSNSNKNIDLVITDIAGKEIKRFDNIVITNLQIDLTNYSCGIYYIEISSDDQIFREKIVKD